MSKMDELFDLIFDELTKLAEEPEHPPPKSKSLQRDAPSTTKKSSAPRRKSSGTAGSAGPKPITSSLP